MNSQWTMVLELKTSLGEWCSLTRKEPEALRFAPFLKPLTLGKSRHPKGTKTASSSLQRVPCQLSRPGSLSAPTPLHFPSIRLARPCLHPEPPLMTMERPLFWTILGQLRILTPTRLQITPGRKSPLGVLPDLLPPNLQLEPSLGLRHKTVSLFAPQLLLHLILTLNPNPKP